MGYARISMMLVVFCSFALGGCTSSAGLLEQSHAPLETVEVEPAAPGIDWVKALDCRSKLGILQQGLLNGSIETLETTPFTLVSDQLPVNSPGRFGSRKIWQGGMTTASDDGVSRCVIRLGEATDHKAEHRILSQERVRSSYQSGSHREKNPAYDAAQARLRQAERANKPGKSSVISVGDPLIDLVGTLIGGAITGVGRWGQGDQVDEAIDALTATPRSVEQPIYRSYQFERTRIRASREAVIPVILTDRKVQRSWRISLKRREVRDLAVLEGLDRQDRDYTEHREGSMTDQELRRWQAEPPKLPLEDMIVSLLSAPAASSVDRVSGFEGPDDDMIFREDDVMDAAARPLTSGRKPVDDRRTSPLSLGVNTASPGMTGESLVRIVGTDHQGQGVYIAPTFVLTTSDLVEGHGLIDVEDWHGGRVLGLIAAVDRSRGLALIQVPRPGRPIILDAGWPGSSDQPDHLVRYRRSAAIGVRDRSLDDDMDSSSGPILNGHRLLGFRSQRGPDISLAEIKAFLGGQSEILISQR